eukprot:11750305-Alexandrium_andersonii.AAC.1
MAFQNRYREIYGPNHAVMATLSFRDSWPDKRVMTNYIGSITSYGRPVPPDFVVIAVKKKR